MYDKTIRRRRAVLLGLVLSSLILVTVYFGESASSPLHSVQRGVMTIVSPIQDGASRALKPVRDLFGWVGDTVSAKGDLKKARKDRDSWQAKANALQSEAADNAHFRGLLKLDDAVVSADYAPVTAQVIGQDPSLWYRQIYINKGSSSGIRRDMPVVAADGSAVGNGLVGKVLAVSPGSATVGLLTGSLVEVPAVTASVPAVPGTIHPLAGDPNDLVLEGPGKGDDVSQGMTVVTRGTVSQRKLLQDVYPRGLPIGRVTKVTDPGSQTTEVHVRPFVDLRRVAYVQVLTAAPNGNR
jgi:rod shape-determining protein MreC